MNTTEIDRTALKARLVKTSSVLLYVGLERERQNVLHPTTNCSLPHIPPGYKLGVLTEETGEVGKEVMAVMDAIRTGDKAGYSNARARLRTELLQVAAVAVAWVESLEN
jgi:hypothetical protein